MRLIETFIGRSNICSTSLDALSENRFEAFNLYGKKVASIGETNFGLLQKTELIKRLSGRDTITYEAKNKGAFFGINTAKLIISSNSLPTSDDTSDGFYRRFLIVDFPNQFTEKQDILKKIPVEEYSNLAKWCVDNLPGILETGGFHNEGDIEHRKKKYIMASNPLPIFIEQFCDVGEDNKKYWVSGSNLYTEFVKMLTLNKRRVVKRKEFHTAMTELGFEQAKVTRNFGDHEIFNGWAYLGLRLNLGKVTKVTKVTRFSTNPPRIENQVENSSRLSLLSLKDELVAVFGALERLETPELSLFVTPEKVDLACSQGLIMEIKPGIWQLTGVSDGNH